MNKRLFTFIFILIIVGVFSGILLHIKLLDYVFKPLIMISIGGYFLSISKKSNQEIVWLTSLAFVFSLFGDIFLMYANKAEIYFMFGLVSFLIAQIFYILLFRLAIKLTGREPYLRKNRIYLIAYILFGATIYFLLFNHLDIFLKIAVLIYMTAILSMSAMALNLFKTVSSNSASFIFFGSVLFVVSDTLIALDKFLKPIPNNEFFVMSTYIAAQYLIMRGILRQLDI